MARGLNYAADVFAISLKKIVLYSFVKENDDWRLRAWKNLTSLKGTVHKLCLSVGWEKFEDAIDVTC